MKNLKKSTIELICILMFSGIFFISCNKDEVNQELPIEQTELITDYDQAIEMLSKHIIETDGKFIFDDQKNQFGIEASLYEELKGSLNEFNDLIANGELSMEEANDSFMENEVHTKSCNRTGVDRRWYGIDLYLSRSNTIAVAQGSCTILLSKLKSLGGVICRGLGYRLQSHFICSCGTKTRITYTGKILWTSCQ
ncbi:hypothetical protein [Aquimarina algicola]|uniref:Uncharacterized protein n=1 Tax=Aquimarina algicola TaxID=2589995 RepID=A0A504JAS9_9FLAO|nr:hypothetical protein [Aquimarina algicola]TPN84643.1 hypothetical protein FHK87_17080 [Aquimarina algicola]